MFTKDSRILNHRLTVPLTSIAKAVGDVLRPTLNQLIKSLFSNGEQGFVYDPNDLTTMFQDAVGTVPVTGAGQAVGLVLDKSKGLLIGNEIISDAELNNAAYWTATANVAVSNGVATFTNATTAQALISPNGITSLNQWYEIEIFVDSITSGQLIVAETGGSMSSVLLVGLNKVKILANGSARSLRIYSLGTTNAVISKFSAKPIMGNHAYQTNAASRPLLQRNATTGAYYLAFDGTDDFLVTNSINFTATDKISLFAGVRKLSDAAIGMLLELSVSADGNNSSFYLTTPFNTTTAFRFYTKGSNGNPVAVSSPASAYAGQTSVVLSVKSQMVASSPISLRVDQNNYQFVNPSALGNYGNYPLYIGRRGGTALPFNGHIYGLIGIGRLTTDSETKALEKLIAKNTGVTLSV